MPYHESQAETISQLAQDPHLIGESVSSWMRAMNAAATAAGIGQYSLIIGGYGQDEHGRELPAKHIAVAPEDSPEDVTDKAVALNREAGRSIYFGLVLQPPGSTIRVNANRVLAVAGLGADIDRIDDKRGSNDFDVTTLPLPPTIDVLSSRHDAAADFNHNLIWVFDRAIPLAEAKPLADRLSVLVCDKGPATKDPVHVWRIPGSISWTKRAKARGVQISGLGPTTTWQVVTTAAFAQMLPPAATEPTPTLASSADEQRPPAARYDGCVGEYNRIIAAMKRTDQWMAWARENGETRIVYGVPVDIRVDDFWCGKIGRALHHWTNGGPLGASLWTAFTRGDNEFGFIGYPPCYDGAELMERYNSFKVDHDNPVTANTIIGIATSLGGVNLSRRRFGLGPRPPSERPLGADVQNVLDHAAAYNALKREGRDRRYRAREAAEAMALRAGLTRIELSVLLIVKRLINDERGYAWPGPTFIADAVERLLGERVNPQSIRNALRKIEDANLIARSAHNSWGPHGRGQAAALASGEHDNWEAALEWDASIVKPGLAASATEPASGEEVHQPDAVSDGGSGEEVHQPDAVSSAGGGLSGEKCISLMHSTDSELVPGRREEKEEGREEQIHNKKEQVREQQPIGEAGVSYPHLRPPNIAPIFMDVIQAGLKASRRTAHFSRLDAKLGEALGYGINPAVIASEMEAQLGWMLSPKKDGTSRPASEIISAMADLVVQLIGDRPSNAVALQAMTYRKEAAARRLAATAHPAAGPNAYARAKDPG